MNGTGGVDLDVVSFDGRLELPTPRRRSGGRLAIRRARQSPPAASVSLDDALATLPPDAVVALRCSLDVYETVAADPVAHGLGPRLWVIVGIADAVAAAAIDRPDGARLLARHIRPPTATTPEREFADLRANRVDGVVMARRDWNEATVSLARRFALMSMADDVEHDSQVDDLTRTGIDAISTTTMSGRLQRPL